MNTISDYYGQRQQARHALRQDAKLVRSADKVEARKAKRRRRSEKRMGPVEVEQ